MEFADCANPCRTLVVCGRGGLHANFSVFRRFFRPEVANVMCLTPTGCGSREQAFRAERPLTVERSTHARNLTRSPESDSPEFVAVPIEEVWPARNRDRVPIRADDEACRRLSDTADTPKSAAELPSVRRCSARARNARTGVDAIRHNAA